jgi:hypothetical protein
VKRKERERREREKRFEAQFSSEILIAVLTEQTTVTRREMKIAEAACNRLYGEGNMEDTPPTEEKKKETRKLHIQIFAVRLCFQKKLISMAVLCSLCLTTNDYHRICGHSHVDPCENGRKTESY